MTLAEFLQAFVNGVLKLQSPPVVALYLVFVAMAPLWIRYVRPLGLHKVLIFYNFACSLISLYSVVFIIKALTRNWPHSIFNTEEDSLVKHAFWVYYMSKYMELMDTIFMIVRHRQRQITLLHVYHHATMVMLSEYAYTYGARQAMSVPLGLNGIIHVVLYFYYGQSALNPGTRPAWKKTLTQLQLVQFYLDLVHLIVGYIYHGFCIYAILYTLSMMGLFSNFYYHAYVKVKPVSIEKVD